MNKSDFVAEVANIAGLSKADANKAVDAIQEAIVAAIKGGDEVALPQLGKFFLKESSARDGVNPATGAKIKIAASKSVGFKAGKAAKDALK